jgi:acyl-CoA thioester hydrolase
MHARDDSVSIRVRYAETDQMGRAHHAHYLVWCELGRTHLMRERGLAYAALERTGVFLPVAHAELEYRLGVGYDDEVRVETQIDEVRSRSVVFGYRLFRTMDERLIASGSTKLVCTDKQGRLQRMPDHVLDALDAAKG